MSYCFPNQEKHMLVAGIALAVWLRLSFLILVATGELETGLKFADINNLIVNVGIKDMLSKYLVPVIYAAGAVMIARSGSFKSFS